MSKQKTLSSYLPYFQFDEDSQILWMKDGSASFSFALTPRVVASLTEEEHGLLRSGLTSAMNQLTEGVTVQVMFLRLKSAASSDPALIHWRGACTEKPGQGAATKLFDAKSLTLRDAVDGGDVFHTKIVVTVYVPARVMSQARRMGPLSHVSMVFGKSTMKPKAQVAHDLTDAVSTLKLSLQAQGYECSDLSTEERRRYLFEYFNPERAYKPKEVSHVDGV